MTGLVARIIESSFIDGPGHRAVVFLQGCDMRCLYCHNPETQAVCTHCGACVTVCPAAALEIRDGRVEWDASRCVACDACIQACPAYSSPKVMALTAGALAGRIGRLAAFIDGVTFSGGECTLQADFLAAAADAIRAVDPRLSIMADTNGGAQSDVFDSLAGAIDGFIFDLKAPDERRHVALTGRPLAPVLRNLGAAARAGKLVEVRCVLVEGWNDSEEDVLWAARLVAELGSLAKLRLIPFRPQGVRGELAAATAFPKDRFLRLVELARGILGARAVTPLPG